MFLFRLMVVAALIKSSIDILMVGKDTPPTIVRRTHKILRRIQEYVYIDQDVVLRPVMLFQKEITILYGLLILAFSVLVVVNCRFFIRPLISLILSSIVFFYVEFDRAAPELISEANL